MLNDEMILFGILMRIKNRIQNTCEKDKEIKEKIKPI